jgi:hypothetical protein
MEQAMRKETDDVAVPEKNRETEVVNLNEKKQEMKERSIEEKYKNVFNFRNEQYARDIEENPAKEVMLSNLETHNNIVLDYAVDLAENEKLSPQDRVAAIIATIMHDSGKLSSDLLNHHKKGVEYAQKMLEEMEEKKESFEGIEITGELKQKVLQAIERHMNHPFLVMLNKGEKFPMPENSVDQVVYDADMLANVGFKNVAFRLASEEFLKEDLKKANENNTNAIEEAFKNVMEGVVKLDSVVLSSSAQKIAKERIQDVNRIFNYLKEKSVFKTILEKTSSISEKLQVNALVEDDSVMLKKKLLNEEISSAGMELGIDSKIINKFIM